MKPDQLIKRRGKLGLIKVKADLHEVQDWVKSRLNQEIQVLQSIMINNVSPAYTRN